MKQGLFEVFGSGKIGLKADGLNQNSELIANAGMIIPEGVVIATDTFDQLIKKIDFEELSKEMEMPACPAFLSSINEDVLDRLKIGVPYAIRSSALSEQGGTGIYKTAFLVLINDRIVDLQNLWHCELLVYASEFTGDAKAWRLKSNSPVGMAILVQPVIGFNFDGNYLPALSGVAYTSYQGLPTVRATIGLGTLAVNGEGVIFNYSPDEYLNFQREMWDQEFADTISPDGTISKLNSHYEELHDEIALGFGAFKSLFDKLATLKKERDVYLEWVILKDKIYIVQCAIYEDHLPGNIFFDSTDYFLLFSGKDVFNSGKVTCKSVVYAHAWTAEISQALEHLNNTIKDYLLVVPQDALSALADRCDTGGRLSLRHFSNASALVEKQKKYTKSQRNMMGTLGEFLADHTFGNGASHFSQLCNRADILYIGGEFDSTPLFAEPGGVDFRNDIGVTIWNISAEVVADASAKKGFVYVSKKAKKIEYSQHQLENWSHDLRRVASLLDSKKSYLANHFYSVLYAIVPDSNSEEFDPFKLDLDDSIIDDFGVKAEFASSLKIVIDNGETLCDERFWNKGMKIYLEELLLRII